MNEAASHRVLVLGATGKTGSRVASKLSERGVSVCTGARTGAEVHFDWDDPATFEPPSRAPGLFLFPPVMRTDFASVVSRFLDKAGRACRPPLTSPTASGTPPPPAARRPPRRLAPPSPTSSIPPLPRPPLFLPEIRHKSLKAESDAPHGPRPRPPPLPGHRLRRGGDSLRAGAARRSCVRSNGTGSADARRGRQEHLRRGRPDHRLPGHRSRRMGQRNDRIRRARRVRRGPARAHGDDRERARITAQRRRPRRNRHQAGQLRRVRRRDRLRMEGEVTS